MDKSKRNVVKKKLRKTEGNSIQRRGRRRNSIPNPLKSEDNFKLYCSFDESTSSSSNVSIDRNLLSNWNFPPKIHQYYATKGITKLFDWQVECLNRDHVLEGKNLVYSAPTSAGKSMVSDILLFKNLLEVKKKAIIILPFVSVTQERMLALKKVLKSIGVRVDAFTGGTNPRGGLTRVDVAVCTIEKANNMINRLIEDKKLTEIGLIVVDELHMIGDKGRGCLLELLLTKVLYLKPRIEHNIQIVGMSATIPNLDVIAKWLKAELYITDFRPVPLYERVIFDDMIYNFRKDQSQQLTEYRTLDLSQTGIKSDDSKVIFLAIETLSKGLGALIFCATKSMCESLCRNIATNIYAFGRGQMPSIELNNDIAKNVVKALDFIKIKGILEQLHRCPAGCDPILESTVKFGVAFHHAGLSLDERAIIEQSFRDGIVRILCATSTLSAGVNLPARLVIIKSPLDFRQSVMDVLTYKQMIGRAGRQGVDTEGESILICNEKNKQKGVELLKSDLKPICSWLLNNYSMTSTSSSTNRPIDETSFTGLKRAILEIIANGTATCYEDISNYIDSTFFASLSSDILTKSVIDDIIAYLIDKKLIHSMIDTDSQQQKISPTQFGKAVLASGLSPEQGLFIIEELDRAQKNLCLSNDLHLLYEVTPTYLNDSSKSISWQDFNDIWNKLDANMKKVGHMVGIQENFIYNQFRVFDEKGERMLKIHQRFYNALALHELIQEVPLYEVAKKFKCTKGDLQALQRNASVSAGMITAFCNKLGWHNLELLIDQFQSRLYFGVQRDLIDLMRISCLNSSLARLLFNHQYDTVVSLAKAKPSDIEIIFMNSGPFDKNKDMGSSSVWIQSLSKTLTVKELVDYIIVEARDLINKDLGVIIYDWVSQTSTIDTNDIQLSQQLSQENIEFSQIENNFTNILNRNSNNDNINVNNDVKSNNNNGIAVENSEIAGECLESIEDMSIIEQSVTGCVNLSFKPCLTSPRVSSSIGLDSPNFVNFHDTSASNQKLVSSTPNRVKSKTDDKQIDENVSEIILINKNTSLSFNLGDSLNDLSWDRLDEEINKISQNFEVIDEELPELPSFRSNHANQSESPDLLVDCDSFSTKSENSSKRTSSPSPSGKMGERQAKKSTTSSVVLFQSDNSNLSSEDSYHTFNREYTPSLESIDCPESPIIKKTNFKDIAVQEKYVIQKIDSENLQVIEVLMNKWMSEKVFSIEFILEKLPQNIQLIGSKIKAQKNTTKEINGLDMNHTNKMVTTLIVCFEGDNTVYSITSIAALNKIKEQLKYKFSKEYKIITFDVKLSYKVLKQCFEIDVNTLIAIDWYDLRIAQWLIDPESVCPQSISELIKVHNKQHFYLSLPKSSSFDEVCRSTGLSFSLMNVLSNELESKCLLKAYKRVEIPSRFSLANMELNGIVVDFDYLNKQLDVLNFVKRQLELKAFKRAGMKFDIRKPQTVATVLYEHLGLLSSYYKVQKNFHQNVGKYTNNKKLPKHLSTSKSALKRLEAVTKHPLIPIINQWRSVDFAINKTLRPLLNHIEFNKELNIHSINTLCDDWSSTGRISLHEPNLIGILKDFVVPDIVLSEQTDGVEEEVKFSLRKIFIARNGYTLVSADYSQLELRILAHLSKDEQLIKNLNESTDVFKTMASVWKSKSINEVDYYDRQQAKQICYGMIYGVGDKTLAANLEVTEEEAKGFMRTFLDKYECVKQFINNTIDDCREKEYIETMSGRRRYLPHIKSMESAMRSKAERQAVNSTIQGSAADLLKTAMICVDNGLKDNPNIESRIVLEMHDELMFEVRNDCVQQFVDLLVNCMGHCLTHFIVDLPVTTKIGRSWGELEIVNN